MGRRATRWLIISVVSLLVLLVAADRVGVAVAERMAGDTLQSSQHLKSRPEVDIAGFPFLTQLATGHYDKITVTAKNVPLGSQAQNLMISRLQVVLHDLSVSRSFTRFRAKSGTAVALIGYGELGRVLGVQLSYAGNGRVSFAKTVTFAGQAFHARIVARPRLQDGGLGFTDTSVDGVTGVPDAVVTSLVRLFGITIPLQGIPFDVRLQALSAGAGGVALTLSGTDLVYTK